VLVVDLSTGAPWIEVVDLRVEGSPEPLVLARRWTDGGWAWRGDTRLHIEDHGVIHPVREHGERLPAFPPAFTTLDERYCIAGSELDNDAGDTLRCTHDGYELTTSDGHLERYAPDGLLLARDEDTPGGLLQTWGQDGLATIQAPDGRTIEIDEARVIGSRRDRVARDPSGETVRYSYDDQGRLASVAAAGGLQHRYLYDSEGQLEALLWSDGSRAVLRWDDRGRVVRIDGPGTARWRFDWGDEGLQQAVDASGMAWTIQRGHEGVTVRDPAGRSATLLLDGGRIAGWKDPAGYSTILEHDDQGSLVALRPPNGSRWTIELDDSARLQRLVGPMGGPWRLGWDDEDGRVTISDPAGRVRGYRLDGAGRVTELSDGSGTTGLRYDQAGRVREIVHGTKGSTRIERDGTGRVQTIIDAAGAETRLSDWTGTTPGTVTMPSGGSWKLLFDRLSRVRGVSMPDGVMADWERSPGGGLTTLQIGQAKIRMDRRTDGTITRVTDPLGRLTGWSRDAVGRIASWLRPDGSKLAISRDARGDTQRLQLADRGVQVQRDMQGRPTALVGDGESSLVEWVRDMAGRVSAIRWPTGSIELERDAAGLVRRVVLGDRDWGLSRDPAGRLRAIAEGAQRWTIRRDDIGLVSALEAPGATTTLKRDPRGLPQQAELFGLQLRWRRASDGRPARIEGPGGAALGIQRDSAGRPVLVRFPGGSLLRIDQDRSTRRSLLLEDPSGRTLYEGSASYDPLGRLSALTDASGTQHHRYGPNDELLSIEGETQAWSVFPGRHEGPPGTVLVETDSEGRPLRAEIDLAAPAWGVARRDLDFELDAAGTVQAAVGDAGTALLEHDELGRLLSVTITDAVGGEPVASWHVAWDPFGRPEAIRTHDGETLLSFLDGQLLGLHERGQGAVLLGEPDVGVLAGSEGQIALITGLGGYRELALFPEGDPYMAMSTPGGLRDLGYPGLLADGGRIMLFPGGPSLGPADAREPLSGLPTSPATQLFPWQTLGWPAPDEQVRWPTIDGASTTSWDPGPWEHEGPWTDPLGLLVALGEVQLPITDDWWSPRAQAAPLPWLPAGLEGSVPPLLPAAGALPLREDPVTALLLAAAMPPAAPLDSAALLEVLLAEDLADVPVGWPGIEPPTQIPLRGE